MEVRLTVEEFEAVAQIVGRAPMTRMEGVGWQAIFARVQGQVVQANQVEEEELDQANQVEEEELDGE